VTHTHTHTQTHKHKHTNTQTQTHKHKHKKMSWVIGIVAGLGLLICVLPEETAWSK